MITIFIVRDKNMRNGILDVIIMMNLEIGVLQEVDEMIENCPRSQKQFVM